MATFLDISLLQSVDVIFPALFVFAIVFSILFKTKIIGDSTGINAIIAIVAAFMTLLSRTFVDLINYIIPWFVVLIIFFLLLLLIFRVFGAEEKDIRTYMMEDRSVGWIIIAISLLIIVAGFAHVFGQDLTNAAFNAGTQNESVAQGDVAGGDFQQSVTATLFNPKLLGVIMVFVIAIFAVALLTGQEAPGKIGGGGGGGHGGH